MSLINDALKKAQQRQTQGQSPPPPIPGSAPTPPGAPDAPARQAGAVRDRPLPGQLFMLLAFGAGVLIALSVLATVYLLHQQSAPVVAQAPATLSPTGATAPVLPEKPALAPDITTPPPALLQAIPPPTPAQNPSPTPALAVESPPPPAATAPASTPAAQSSPDRPAQSLFAVNPSNPPGGIDQTQPDPKITAYLDALQVAGIRVSDTGSKVLMNDHVYHENEIVDHLLGLRLKTITEDTLTFVDERGVIYTKNF